MGRGQAARRRVLDARARVLVGAAGLVAAGLVRVEVRPAPTAGLPLFGPRATGPTLGELEAAPAEVDAVLQAQAVHGLIRCDPRMPARLRSMLVAYAGLLLDRDGRATAALTARGRAALAEARHA